MHVLNPEKDIVGIDFDNTIVSYDAIMHTTALERGLISSDVSMNKKEIRDSIRSLPGGEDEWTRLQAVVYGPLMPRARIIDGVRDFFLACRASGVRTCIVSHKTKFAKFDETGTNMRTAALDWLNQEDFFDPQGIGLKEEDVHFGGTREEKIAHIVRLDCTVFIDDLEEVFFNQQFPGDVEKILFSVTGEIHPDLKDVHLCKDWKEIREYCFG